MSKLLNSIGLIMDMTGVLLTYLNTPLHSRKPNVSVPFDAFKQGADWILWGKRVERKERRMIRLGLGMIILGFMVQLAATLLTDSSR